MFNVCPRPRMSMGRGNVHCSRQEEPIWMPQVCWENGCPMTTTDPTYEAAMLGRLGMLKYLHEHGFPWSVGMCIAVTVQIVSYLRLFQCQRQQSAYQENYLYAQTTTTWMFSMWVEKRLPWPKATCFMAGSGNGHMDCLLSEPDHQCGTVSTLVVTQMLKYSKGKRSHAEEDTSDA